MDLIHDGRKHASTWKILVIASIEEVTEQLKCWNNKTIMTKFSEMSIPFHLGPGELLILLEIIHLEPIAVIVVSVL